MELGEILDCWDADCHFDRAELGQEAARTYSLYGKYYKMFCKERAELREMEKILKLLRHEKSEFYQFGPTKEQHLAGWRLPPRGKILKTEVQRFVDADQQVVELAQTVGAQQEKVAALEGYVNMIRNRNFAVTNMITWEKFKHGA